MYRNMYRTSFRAVPRVSAVLATVAMSVVSSGMAVADDLFDVTHLPNNFPFLNQAGTAATFSTAGFVNLANEFHEPQGTNGRSCESCHLVNAGWSIRPADIELKFLLTRGTDPIFNLLDANSPTADVSTVHARRAAYSMLLKGLFRRNGNIPATSEFKIVAFEDPLHAGATATHVEVFRRPLATANFHIARNVGWHDQNAAASGVLHDGLLLQASGNITGGQERKDPVDPAVVSSIVTYEEGLAFAQQFAFGVGSLSSCGAKGGPENLSAQPPVAGRFDIYDAWIDLVPGTCTTRAADRKRAQIARGQQLFNNGDANHARCSGCHNAANNGSNVDGRLFDIGASSAALRRPGMPLYTLQRTTETGTETRVTTDPGRAIKSGKWTDIDKFKVPSLRGLSARAPYFHNGTAAKLSDVVAHYEAALDFKFDERPGDREALVAFLEAL